MTTSIEIVGEQVALRPEAGGYGVWRDGTRVGSVRLEVEGNVVTLRALCIDEPLRGRGLGSDAARALVRGLEANEDVHLARAWAPPDRGLAVYFWFRMGLRPVHGEGPAGGIWLERATVSPAAASPGPA